MENWPFIGDLPIQIAIFHSYVSLPKGNAYKGLAFWSSFQGAKPQARHVRDTSLAPGFFFAIDCACGQTWIRRSVQSRINLWVSWVQKVAGKEWEGPSEVSEAWNSGWLFLSPQFRMSLRFLPTQLDCKSLQEGPKYRATKESRRKPVVRPDKPW